MATRLTSTEVSRNFSAVLTRVHGVAVVTENARDFSRVPGLDVVVPSTVRATAPAS